MLDRFKNTKQQVKFLKEKLSLAEEELRQAAAFHDNHLALPLAKIKLLEDIAREMNKVQREFWKN